MAPKNPMQYRQGMVPASHTRQHGPTGRAEVFASSALPSRAWGWEDSGGFAGKGSQ